MIELGKSIMDFLFSWNGYFIMMPIWFILLLFFILLWKKEIWVIDIFGALFGGLINPIVSLCVLIFIGMIPILFIWLYVEDNYGWKNIGNKRLL